MLEAFCLDGYVHMLGVDAEHFEFPTLRLLKAAVREKPDDQYL